MLGFCYLFATDLKLLQAGSLERFVFHVDAPLWMFFQCLFSLAILVVIRNTFGLFSINSTSLGRDFIVLISIVPILALINTYIAIVVFEQMVFGKSHNLYQWITTYLHEIILQSVAGLGAISYFYISTTNEIRERLSAAQLAQSQYQLKVLQQKVDPHFLFNNLNVLSALIEKDATVANEYLANLAKLYRYILHTQNAELVPINDEVDFAKSYAYLLHGRFGNAYDFDWQISEADVSGRMIVPTTIQSLLENVIKHNAGSREIPLSVRVRIRWGQHWSSRTHYVQN